MVQAFMVPSEPGFSCPSPLTHPLCQFQARAPRLSSEAWKAMISGPVQPWQSHSPHCRCWCLSVVSCDRERGLKHITKIPVTFTVLGKFVLTQSGQASNFLISNSFLEPKIQILGRLFDLFGFNTIKIQNKLRNQILSTDSTHWWNSYLHYNLYSFEFKDQGRAKFQGDWVAMATDQYERHKKLRIVVWNDFYYQH